MTIVKTLKAKWSEDPKFRAEYDALEEEFTLAAAMIEARMRASMTQEQIAKATGTKLRIRFEKADETPG